MSPKQDDEKLTREEVAKQLTMAAYANGVLKIEDGNAINAAGAKIGKSYKQILGAIDGEASQAALDIALTLLALDVDFENVEIPDIGAMYDQVVWQCEC